MSVLDDLSDDALDRLTSRVTELVTNPAAGTSAERIDAADLVLALAADAESDGKPG